MNQRKLNRFVKLHPWVYGISGDLIFWIPLNTLFLSTVKGFGNAEIVSLTTIASVVSLIVQPLLMKFLPRIGNTLSVRIGLFMLFFANILFLLGPSYGLIVVGTLLYREGQLFLSMTSIQLKNNLSLLGKDELFVDISAKATLNYAVASCIASLTSGFLFNFNPYLPIILGLVISGVCFAFSCTMGDYSAYDRTDVKKRDKNTKFPVSALVVWIVISYALFITIVSEGTQHDKLFVQEELLGVYPLERVTILLSAVVTASRIGRVLGNMLLNKMRRKFGNRFILVLAGLLIASQAFLLVGAFFDVIPALKLILMGLGYVLLLFVRDPCTILSRTMALDAVPKENQQTMLMTLNFAQKVLVAVVNICMSWLVLQFPVIVLVVILLLLSLVELYAAIRLHGLLKASA